jgi:hypothetical protein
MSSGRRTGLEIAGLAAISPIASIELERKLRQQRNHLGVAVKGVGHGARAEDQDQVTVPPPDLPENCSVCHNKIQDGTDGSGNAQAWAWYGPTDFSRAHKGCRDRDMAEKKAEQVETIIEAEQKHEANLAQAKAEELLAQPVRPDEGGDEGGGWKAPASIAAAIAEEIAKHRYPGCIDNWFTYHPPTADQVAIYENLRNHARELAHLIAIQVPAGLERDQAMAHLRDAVMWSNAGIACNGS